MTHCKCSLPTANWCCERCSPKEIVLCDDNCGAKSSPETLEEYKMALEHWMHHSMYGGCYHGA